MASLSRAAPFFTTTSSLLEHFQVLTKGLLLLMRSASVLFSMRLPLMIAVCLFPKAFFFSYLNLNISIFPFPSTPFLSVVEVMAYEELDRETLQSYTVTL